MFNVLCVILEVPYSPTTPWPPWSALAAVWSSQLATVEYNAATLEVGPLSVTCGMQTPMVISPSFLFSLIPCSIHPNQNKQSASERRKALFAAAPAPAAAPPSSGALGGAARGGVGRGGAGPGASSELPTQPRPKACTRRPSGRAVPSSPGPTGVTRDNIDTTLHFSAQRSFNIRSRFRA